MGEESSGGSPLVINTLLAADAQDDVARMRGLVRGA